MVKTFTPDGNGFLPYGRFTTAVSTKQKSTAPRLISGLMCTLSHETTRIKTVRSFCHTDETVTRVSRGPKTLEPHQQLYFESSQIQ